MFNCCATCGNASTRKFCSDDCKWRGAKKMKCVDCNRNTGWRHTDKRAGSSPRCRPCLRNHKGPQRHGTLRMYRAGKCRCDLCSAANAKQSREYAANFRERNGFSLRSKYRNASAAKKHSGVPMKVRREVYERDNWTCQICFETVDPTLHFNDRMAATVDHIECQSWALIPDNSLKNLRLAHRACNSRRRDREVA